ncbi:MAG: hypothetical protein L3V56_14965, partial [Candidatus Magnetoovum sp. WYHC-5]|nr:hypothetical protein [Candidatus Magnetoovum sp. WYHC-5]
MYEKIKYGYRLFIVFFLLIVFAFNVNAESVNNFQKNDKNKTLQKQMYIDDLYEKVNDKLIWSKGLEQYKCSTDYTGVTPTRRVVQFIENTFYEWYEYEKFNSKGELESFCIDILKPQNKILTQHEAQILLSSSKLWEEQYSKFNAQLLPDATKISPDDPLVKEGKSVGYNTYKRTVTGTDDRKRVSKSALTQYPLNTVSFLLTYTDKSTCYPSSSGTAFLVGPYMALTCGHNLYVSNNSNGVCNNIEASKVSVA